MIFGPVRGTNYLALASEAKSVLLYKDEFNEGPESINGLLTAQLMALMSVHCAICRIGMQLC